MKKNNMDHNIQSISQSSSAEVNTEEILDWNTHY